MTDPGRECAKSDIERSAASLRHQMVAALSSAGHVRSPRWRAAAEAVPRHEFVREFFVATNPDEPAGGADTVFVPVDAEQAGIERWLQLAYADASLITQLDGHLAPDDVTGPVTGAPTSSSTMPSLVLRMWEHLDVHDDHQVLEIGTGTGYSTALGCHRLGEDHVTSVEVDPAVAERAQAALHRAGYHPRLLVGDGLGGCPDGAPYDRVIATCALRYVPIPWVEQCRSAAVILVTLSGWLDATGLAKLTVTGPGSAEGRFIDHDVSFMPARAHAPEPVMIPKLDDDLISMRPAQVGPEVFDDWGPVRRVIQLAVPNAQYLQPGPGQDLPEHLLVQSDDSYVTFHQSSQGRWTVRQGGRHALWDHVEHAVTTWRDAGAPPLTEFRITVTPHRQTIGFRGGGAWDLAVESA